MAHMQHTSIIKTALLVFLMSVAPAFALQSDYSQPINVVSKEQLADLNNDKIIFQGDVKATQGTMEIVADKIEVTRSKSGDLKSIIAYGTPVTFKQQLDNGKPINTRSATLSYMPQESLVVLSGKASIWQGESRMEGERIEYNIKTQKMRANNQKAQGGRVSSTFIPSELQKQK